MPKFFALHSIESKFRFSDGFFTLIAFPVPFYTYFSFGRENNNNSLGEKSLSSEKGLYEEFGYICSSNKTKQNIFLRTSAGINPVKRLSGSMKSFLRLVKKESGREIPLEFVFILQDCPFTCKWECLCSELFSQRLQPFSLSEGPGLPVPMILPSSLVTGADSAAVPVTKISSAV